jgi:hypothetical protein
MPIYILSDNSVVSATGFTPLGTVKIVPDTFTKEDYPFLYTQTNPETGEIEVLLNEIAKGEWLASKSVADEKTLLHSQYIADIDEQMTLIFHTTDRDKASAMYNTWQEWKNDPSFFSGKGLLDEFGNSLDSAVKISTYANQKLNQCKDYSVFLMLREKQFRDAIALL